MLAPSLSFVVVGVAAFAASTLTLFSGFGLGTVLMPVFALFFPVPVAVAATAVVHAANNLFKLLLLRRAARWSVIAWFGLPAVGAAFVGAGLLATLALQAPLMSWSLAGRVHDVTPIELVMGLLILAFAVIELVPALHAFRVSPRWLPLGGAVSGFFGGLSGHQGAFRAAFLAPLGLSPAEFAATQAVLACLVDAARLLVYGGALGATTGMRGDTPLPAALVGVAMACAFGGALLGRWLLPSMTIARVRALTGGLLLVVGIVLAAGMV